MERNKHVNPFEYDAAVNFATDELIEYFVEDHNYSRFIQSTRNIFIVGERGCGKSMMLLYNSYQKQKRKNEKEDRKDDLSKIGIYVPCTNTLFFKKEYELIDNPFKVSVISEHFFVLAIAYELAIVLASMENLVSKEREKTLKDDLNYILNIKLRESDPLFDGMAKYIEKISVETQEHINSVEDSFSEKCVSFYSLVIPLLRVIKTVEKLKDSHFIFLVDDAHDLNIHQIKALNSWIAYRDHSYFSFKVAVAKVKSHTLITASGSSILEGHDFLRIDMEKAYQNKFSDFGLWAKGIIEKRLVKSGLSNKSVEDFFPMNQSVAKELEECNELMRQKAISLYGKNQKKKINDYVYKYGRAEYFKRRPDRANLPIYSGWENVVHLSTGIIRNLLYPCYWMFDKEISVHKSKINGQISPVASIRPSYQDEVIKEKSQELWNKIDRDLFNNIDNCSTKQAEQVKNLFENLILLFRKRLMSDISEPRAITFTISARKELTEMQNSELEELLRISKEAQILYNRVSSAKDDGKREMYYVPNRMLLPIRGLDPVGQHARVSIQAKELYAAAMTNKLINQAQEASNTLFDYD